MNEYPTIKQVLDYKGDPIPQGFTAPEQIVMWILAAVFVALKVGVFQ